MYLLWFFLNLKMHAGFLFIVAPKVTAAYKK